MGKICVDVEVGNLKEIENLAKSINREIDEIMGKIAQLSCVFSISRLTEQVSRELGRRVGQTG